MSENNIMVHIGDDAQISDNLRSALENLIEAVEASDLADDEVTGFVARNAKQIKIGSTRPPIIIKDAPVGEFGCWGYEYTPGEGDSCWVFW